MSVYRPGLSLCPLTRPVKCTLTIPAASACASDPKATDRRQPVWRACFLPATHDRPLLWPATSSKTVNVVVADCESRYLTVVPVLDLLARLAPALAERKLAGDRPAEESIGPVSGIRLAAGGVPEPGVPTFASVLS